jgi:hypothetical protein
MSIGKVKDFIFFKITSTCVAPHKKTPETFLSRVALSALSQLFLLFLNIRNPDGNPCAILGIHIHDICGLSRCLSKSFRFIITHFIENQHIVLLMYLLGVPISQILENSKENQEVMKLSAST